MIKAGMRVDAGIAEGKAYLTAASQDRSGSVEIRDGKAIEKGALRDADVPGGYKFSGSYTKETDLKEGKTISAYTGIVNGKEGHLTVGADGKAVFMKAEGGEVQQQMKVNTKTIDSSTTIDAGTHVKGAKGLTDYGPQTLLHKMSMGDRDITSPISTAVTNASKNAVINDLAAQSSGAVTPFVKTSGKNLHNAIASASISIGAGTPPLSPIQAKAGLEGKAEIGSRQETNYDLMTQGYRHVLNAATQEADKLGLKGQDRNVFISNKYNEFSDQLFKNIDKEQGFGIHRPKELVRQAKENLLEKKPSSQSGSW